MHLSPYLTVNMPIITHQADASLTHAMSTRQHDSVWRGCRRRWSMKIEREAAISSSRFHSRWMIHRLSLGTYSLLFRLFFIVCGFANKEKTEDGILHSQELMISGIRTEGVLPDQGRWILLQTCNRETDCCARLLRRLSGQTRLITESGCAPAALSCPPRCTGHSCMHTWECHISWSAAHMAQEWYIKRPS